jgi:signal transduction histidine kinase
MMRPSALLQAIAGPRTLFAKMWKSLLLIMVVTFLVHAVLVMKSLQLGAEAQTERRLARIGEHWGGQPPLSEPLRLDPVTVVYPGYEHLPPNIRQWLSPDARGIFELGERAEDYFVLAQSSPAGPAFYVVEFHFEVKPSESIEHAVFFWYLLGITPLFLLLLWLCKRVTARVTAPMRAVGRLVVAREPASLAPLALPPGASLELEALVAQINGSLLRTAEVLDRERRFTQFASHELRTPAAVVQAALERIEARAVPGQEQAIERAHRGLRDMHVLIDTFLRLSADPANGPEEAWTTVNAAWVASLYAHVTAGHPERELKIAGADALVLDAPESMVHVLLANMLKNALFHGGPGPVQVTIDKSFVEVGNDLPEHASPRGHGVGTQIAHRICTRFHWRFSLTIGEGSAVARVSCPSEAGPGCPQVMGAQ